MTQKQLNELVAQATGEDLDEIQRRGFSIADPVEANFDPEPYDLRSWRLGWNEIISIQKQVNRKRRRIRLELPQVW